MPYTHFRSPLSPACLRTPSQLREGGREGETIIIPQYGENVWEKRVGVPRVRSRSKEGWDRFCSAEEREKAFVGNGLQRLFVETSFIRSIHPPSSGWRTQDPEIHMLRTSLFSSMCCRSSFLGRLNLPWISCGELVIRPRDIWWGGVSPLLDENEFNRSEIFLVQDERRTRTPHSGELGSSTSVLSFSADKFLEAPYYRIYFYSLSIYTCSSSS